MKTITYTYMRDHLTEVLDALRLGEDIKVTQRGKADMILSGSPKLDLDPQQFVGKYDMAAYGSGGQLRGITSQGVWSDKRDRQPTNSSGKWKPSNPSSQHNIPASGNLKPSKSSGGLKPGQNLSKASKDQKSGKRMSFSEAKERTKSRHAGVIKMLGDK